MLRHSVSQVFGSKHPALSPRGDDDIGPRPFDATNFAIQAQTLYQVSRRSSSNAPVLNPLLESSQYQDLTPAPAIRPMPTLSHMPRNVAGPVPHSSTISHVAQRDASNLHPVFFTERLRKTPFILDAVGVTSPVACGYAYQEVQRRADGTIPAML
ncbi:hypothetical protein M434DRAFT_151675 [Hypoxylon sp. CO27-5]|nr:hypothetical protein M434DRAFT_151675 [Hypoxylon sp. CO27-5]